MRFIDLKTRAVVKKNRYLLRQERVRSFRAIAAVQLKTKTMFKKNNNDSFYSTKHPAVRTSKTAID